MQEKEGATERVEKVRGFGCNTCGRISIRKRYLSSVMTERTDECASVYNQRVLLLLFLC